MKRVGLLMILLAGCHRDLDLDLCEHNPAYCADASGDADQSDAAAEVEGDGAAEVEGTDSASTETSAAEDTSTAADSDGSDTSAEASADSMAIADTAIADAAIADTTVADTTVADTTVVDTTVVDTAIADTAVADTKVVDTAVVDSTVTDTGVADTGYDAGADTRDSAPVDTCVCVPGEVLSVTGTCSGALEKKTKTCLSSCTWGAEVCAIPRGWTSIANPPGTFQGRLWSAHAWTGGEVIIHGGRLTTDGGGAPFADGAIYDLKKNSWTLLPTTNAPAARAQHVGVWFGFSFMVWGGRDGSGYRSDGAIYDAFGKVWDLLPASPLSARANPASMFIPTTGEVFIWGGDGPGDPASDGALYSPSTSTWTKLPIGPLSGRAYASIGWTGSEVLVWGGMSASGPSADGALFDPVKRTWRSIPAATLAGRIFTGTATTSGQFAFFAGSSGATVYNDGAVIDLATFSWRNVPTPSAVTFPARSTPAFWQLGSRLYLWSGVVVGTGGLEFQGSGASYDLSSTSWSALDIASAPTPRVYSMVQTTGTAAIVWSGISQPSGGIPAVVDDGAIFVP